MLFYWPTANANDYLLYQIASDFNVHHSCPLCTPCFNFFFHCFGKNIHYFYLFFPVVGKNNLFFLCVFSVHGKSQAFLGDFVGQKKIRVYGILRAKKVGDFFKKSVIFEKETLK